MKNRNIKRILLAQDVQMGNITLKQPLPLGNINQIDPFLLLHHVGPKTQIAGGRSIADIGGHPHRGFEPVTFIFKGEIHHRDSRGNDSIIKAGGVQWMTAGRGIIHSESASKSFVEKGGDLEFIQLWVNLPARLKMVQPQYQGFQQEDIPAFISADEKVRVNVIAGTYQNLIGPIQSQTGIRALTLELKAGAKVQIEEKEEHNALLYQLNGIAAVNGIDTGNHKMVTFKQETGNIEIDAVTDGLLLYVAGQPINEKVTQYGPFVMNSQTEILEAMRDYQMGKMGVLI